MEKKCFKLLYHRVETIFELRQSSSWDKKIETKKIETKKICLTKNSLNWDNLRVETIFDLRPKKFFFEKKKFLFNLRTDGSTDGWMDRPSYRDARTHLKTEKQLWLHLKTIKIKILKWQADTGPETAAVGPESLHYSVNPHDPTTFLGSGPKGEMSCRIQSNIYTSICTFVTMDPLFFFLFLSPPVAF